MKKTSFILRQSQGEEGGDETREKQHHGLENMDPRFPTPLFVFECHKRGLDVYVHGGERVCVCVCVCVRGLLGCVTESLSALIA